MLADFPERRPRFQPYDEAIWILEDTLSSFIYRAQDELDAAEASGSPQMRSEADEKMRLMCRARSSSSGGGMNDLEDVWACFEVDKTAYGQ